MRTCNDFPIAADHPRYTAAYERQKAETDCQAAVERIAHAADDDERRAAQAEVREKGWNYCRTPDALQPLSDLLDRLAERPEPLAGLGLLLQRAVGYLRRSGVLVLGDDASLNMDADVTREWQQSHDLMALLMREPVAALPAEVIREEIGTSLPGIIQRPEEVQPAEQPEGEAIAPVVCDESVASPILTVDHERAEVTFHGQTHLVPSEHARRYVKVLATAPGSWMTSHVIVLLDSMLVRDRLRDARKRLPEKIREYIETDRTLGHRFNPARLPRVQHAQ